MKRTLTMLLTLLLVLAAITLPVAANQTVTATEDDYLNVAFSNGYRGFCVDYGLDEAHMGDIFVQKEASEARSNGENPKDVSNYLKVMLVECFHDFFQLGEDNLYTITQETRQLVQRTTWHYTDGYENYWEDISPIIDRVNAAVAGGMVIPDHGYTTHVDDQTQITFDFALMETQKSDQQSFFAYKIEQKNISRPVDPPVDTPTDTPEVDTPTDTPEVDPPVHVPEVETPTDTPEVETPTDTPEVETPTDTPEVETPTDTPVEGEDEIPPITPPTDDDQLEQPVEGEDQLPSVNPPTNGEELEQPTETPEDTTDTPKTGEPATLAASLALATLSAGLFWVMKKGKKE